MYFFNRLNDIIHEINSYVFYVALTIVNSIAYGLESIISWFTDGFELLDLKVADTTPVVEYVSDDSILVFDTVYQLSNLPYHVFLIVSTIGLSIKAYSDLQVILEKRRIRKNIEKDIPSKDTRCRAQREEDARPCSNLACSICGIED